MFFLFILIILFILGLAIHTSRVVIEIQNLVIDTEKPKGERINKQSKIYVYLLIFKKIKLFKKNIRNEKAPNVKFQSEEIDIKFLKNKDFKIDYKELWKNSNVDFKYVELYAQVGTEDAALTAILVGATAGLIGIFLKKAKYQIVPIYSNKNLVKIELNCIISIYLMQYIYKSIFKKMKYFGEEVLKRVLKFQNKKAEV